MAPGPMPDEDAETSQPASQRASDPTAAIPLVSPRAPREPGGQPRKGPVLELATSEPDVDPAPGSERSVDDLLVSFDSLETTATGSGGASPMEDNEPLPLRRGAMVRSLTPPPLPARTLGATAPARPRQTRSSPPPLPGPALPTPPAPPVAGPPPLPSPPPVPAPLPGPPPVPSAHAGALPPPPVASSAAPPVRPPMPARGPSVRPPPPAQRARASVAPPPLPRSVTRGPALDLLTARVASLEAGTDAVLLGRALAELAVVREVTLDDGLCVSSAEAALAKDPTLAGMHSLLRRKQHARGASKTLLTHVEAELAQAAEGPLRVSLLAERARLFAAEGRSDDALAAWSYVLAHEPQHPAALRGKEASLSHAATTEQAGDTVWQAEADHLEAMAEAYADDPKTAAWLLVERAAILELRLRKVDAARRALTHALTLDPRVGPVRRALVRHVARHRDASALIDLLDDEGRLETDPARAARLELEAATIAEGATRETGRAVLLLERAASRAPTTRAVDLEVLGDLTRLLEGAGRAREAARWRRARLPLLESASARAEEHRALARAAEAAGEIDTAIADLEASLKEDGQDDRATLSQLDRLMEGRGHHEGRLALWVTDAARTSDGSIRVASLLRAAHVAERALSRPDEAVRHLRTAWTAKPGHSEVLESLTRLLARPSMEASTDGRARLGLLELYAHAADVVDDGGRKVAYLEKVALLAEETLADFPRAVLAYDAILRIEPGRIGALLGLARNAARAHDDRTLHRALLAQASATRSETDALALRTRAATVIATLDPALALALAEEVLAADATHAAARALVTRLHEHAGRWELVARSIQAELAHAVSREKRAALLYLAEIQEIHLKAPLDALATLRVARAGETDPDDARVLAAIARALEAVQDPKALREAYDALASAARSETERASYLVRAAEISEHRLADDAGALRAYEEALIATPHDARIVDRLDRVRSRGERAYADPSTDPLDHALVLVTLAEEPARARALLDAALATQRAPIPALRLLERLHRGARAWSELALVLARQAETLRAPAPKLGALWALTELEEWRLPTEPDHLTYGRILALDPDDPEALLATIRTRLPPALLGDETARPVVVDALRRRARMEAGGARTATLLVLAHLLEAGGVGETGGDTGRDATAEEAMQHYADVLSSDASSVTAAWGLRRLAHRLGRTLEAVRASASLAELTLDTKVRARHFVDAAELVANADDDARLGDPDARREAAAAFLERALEANPDSLTAAGALTTLRTKSEQPHELLRALRIALGSATERDSVIYLGTEVARLAREDAHDLGVATLAMQKVRDVAPTHSGSLLTLAELYLAQRAWPEAVATLESVVVHATENEPKLTALFALGSIYDKILAQPDEHARVLRAALAIEPESPRALRGLIEQLRGKRERKTPTTDTNEAPPHRVEKNTTELGGLLLRLARAETEPTRKSEVYLELSELEGDAGDLAAAERSIVEAIVQCPASARAFARLGAFFRRETGLDAAAYARALQELISRGRDTGIADARWFAALGQLEVDTLQRLHEGVAHLEWAVQLDPSLHETRFELADAYAKTGARDAAVRSLFSLIVPDARPLTSLADAGLALALLERLLDQEKHPGEAVVVSELRSVLGEIEPGRADWLKSRVLGPFEDHHMPLGRQALVEDVLPKAGRHVLLEVAAAGTGLEAKLLRTNLADLGVSARDRVGARSGHPVRATFDRVIASLGVEEAELVVSPVADRVRVVIHDLPWVVVPASFESLPSGVQIAALARACARILLGVPWLAELSGPAVLGWLVSIARQVAPGYASDEARLPDAQAYEPQVAKAIGRRQRKLLDGLTAHLAMRDGRPPDLAGFLLALDQCTVRAAYLVSGDLTSTLAAVRKDDRALRDATAHPGLPALGALLAHPLLGDTARLALTPEASVLCQRVGSAWAR